MWHRLRGTIAIDVSFAYAVPGENRGCFAPKHRLAPNNNSPQSSNVAFGGEDNFAFSADQQYGDHLSCPSGRKSGTRPVAPHWLRLSAKAQATADRAARALRRLRRLSNLLLKPRIAIASLFALELLAKRFHETKGFWSNPFSVLEDWLSESRAVGVLRRRRNVLAVILILLRSFTARSLQQARVGSYPSKREATAINTFDREELARHLLRDRCNHASSHWGRRRAGAIEQSNPRSLA